MYAAAAAAAGVAAAYLNAKLHLAEDIAELREQRRLAKLKQRLGEHHVLCSVPS